MDDTPDDGRRAVLALILSAAGLGALAKLVRRSAPYVERDLRYGVPYRAATIRTERELPVDKVAGALADRSPDRKQERR